MPFTVIGLTGPAGCGKDTIADMLHDHGFVRVGLADPIKKMVDHLLRSVGVVPNWEDRSWKETPIEAIGASPRKLTQTLGTEWGRELIDPNLWLKVALATIGRWELAYDTGSDDVQGVVISDVRFDNEAALVRGVDAAGGLGRVVHVDRPFRTEVEMHSSENGVAYHPGDIRLLNNGDLMQLGEKVNALAAALRTGEVAVEAI